MLFYQQSNSLIIYGGRNDSLGEQMVLGDMFMLNLQTLTWYQVEMLGNQLVRPKYSFQCCYLSQKLIVFGGMNSEGYCRSELHVIELNKGKVSQLANQMPPCMSISDQDSRLTQNSLYNLEFHPQLFQTPSYRI